MNNKRNILGNKAEEETTKLLTSYGYWAFNIPKGVKGQPFDIIACKENVNWFVDVKHLENNKLSFDFNRIEPNQLTSMNYAKNFSNIKNLGFVIRVDRDCCGFLFLHYDELINMQEKGLKSVKIADLKNFEELI